MGWRSKTSNFSIAPVRIDFLPQKLDFLGNMFDTTLRGQEDAWLATINKS